MIQGMAGTQIVPVKAGSPTEFHSELFARFATVDERILLKKSNNKLVRIIKSLSPKPIECVSSTELTDVAWHNKGQMVVGLSDQSTAISVFDATFRQIKGNSARPRRSHS